jgi:hypothetical protein
MLIKILVLLLLRNKRSYTRAVKLRKKAYVLSVEEFDSPSGVLEKAARLGIDCG